YGVIRLAPVSLSFKKKKTDCFFLLPERTHHREDVELIHKEKLREKLGLRDGDEVTVSFTV
ncbi:MAG: DUF120 domain-containing protein, partial [Candidatus Altiarchaeota archaeon]